MNPSLYFTAAPGCVGCTVCWVRTVYYHMRTVRCVLASHARLLLAGVYGLSFPLIGGLILCPGAAVDLSEGFVGCVRAMLVNGVVQDLRGIVESGQVTYGVLSGQSVHGSFVSLDHLHLLMSVIGWMT